MVNHLPVIGKADGRTFDGITPWTTSPATGNGSGTYPLAIRDLATAESTVAVTDALQPWRRLPMGKCAFRRS
jgi:hypothetical protein